MVLLPAPLAPMMVTISPWRTLQVDAVQRLDVAVADMQIFGFRAAYCGSE
ncbi:MAG: hypothetical protein MZV65_36610 [Chromatiales bacterium]|nr:hypothetical protein [Chromatiales bacterium]